MNQVGIRLVGLARPADRGGVQRFTARSTGEQAVVSTLPFLSQRYAVRAAQVIMNTPAESVQQYDQMVRDVLADLTAPFTDSTRQPGDGAPHLHRRARWAAASARRSRSWSTTSRPRSSRSTRTTSPSVTCTAARACRPPRPVHYSGSPLAVDFGEQDNTNVVCLIEVAPDRPAKITDLPITLRPAAADGHRHRRGAARRSRRLRRGLPAAPGDPVRVRRPARAAAGEAAQRARDPDRPAVLHRAAPDSRDVIAAPDAGSSCSPTTAPTPGSTTPGSTGCSTSCTTSSRPRAGA